MRSTVPLSCDCGHVDNRQQTIAQDEERSSEREHGGLLVSMAKQSSRERWTRRPQIVHSGSQRRLGEDDSYHAKAVVLRRSAPTRALRPGLEDPPDAVEMSERREKHVNAGRGTRAVFDAEPARHVSCASVSSAMCALTHIIVRDHQHTASDPM
jgi:hypothetical protein